MILLNKKTDYYLSKLTIQNQPKQPEIAQSKNM